MDVELELTRGDTPEWAYKLFDESLEPLALQNVTVWLTVKATIDSDSTDSLAVLSNYIAFDASGNVTGSDGFRLGGIDPDPLSPTYGQELTGIFDGIVTHAPTQAETTTIEVGDYLYDVQVKSASGRFKTIIRNAPITVVGDITRRITTP